MGDNRRFNLFAEAIEKRFPKWYRVVDVAGGKGYLQLALKERGFKDVVTFDCAPRKERVRKRGTKFYWRKFGDKVNVECDLLVGMHPDEATDVIVVEAAKRDIPFAIVPCCVKPTHLLWMKGQKYTVWIRGLIELAKKKKYEVEEYKLRMNGKNIVLFGRKAER